MSGIDFVGPGLASLTGPRADEISRAAILPKPYGKENLISDHLINACFFTALELSVQKHVNPVTGEEFSCVSYYTEDQKDIAVSSKAEFGYVTTMSAHFVRRLVKISHLLTRALDLRPRSSSQPEPGSAGRRLEQDHELNALMEGKAQVSEPEAMEIVSNWPATTWGAQVELGDYALFYDMIRLIWVHEWAHSLCGHVALTQTEMGLSQLHEFSAERVEMNSDDDDPRFRRNEVMQAIELHADEFAVRYCLQGVLWGNDPVANMAGPRIDLTDRLLIFNVACCVFTIIWALAEQKHAPGETFWPPAQTSTSDAPAPMFVTTTSTHPPAVLRYERLRGFQRELAMRYGIDKGRPEFGTMVDAYSFSFLETLGELSGYFFSLQAVTPMIARTPTSKVLEAYSTHLVDISASLAHRLEKLYYLPTATLTPAEDESA